MTRRMLKHMLIMWMMAWCTVASAAPPQTWAYQAYWLPDGWRSVPIEQLDRVLFFELKINGKGEIVQRHGWPEQWADLRSELKTHHVPLDLTLTLFDAASFDKLFSSNQATAHLLAAAVDLAGHKDVAGLHLDVEMYNRLRPATLSRFRQFVRDLTAQLQQQSPPRALSVFFPVGGASVLYDAATLQRINTVVVQGYDSHSSDSQFAGPVAPLGGNDEVTWIKAVAQVAALGVPKDRMVLTFPLFGYEWCVSTKAARGKAIGPGVPTSFAPLPAASELEITRHVQTSAKQGATRQDRQSGSAYYHYTDRRGHLIEGWFENRSALDVKSDYLQRQKLGGIAFFVLGYDAGELVNFYLQRRDDVTDQPALLP